MLYWYHTAFIGVARRRYLSSSTQRRHVHSSLAHYFLGSWGGGRKKPFQYSRKQLLYMSLKKNRQTQKNRYYSLNIFGSLSATTVVLVLVVTRFRKMPKALLIRNGKLRNFA